MGLQRVPGLYTFYEEETVVIIVEDSDFKGYDAVVKGVDVKDPLVVTLFLVQDIFSFNKDDKQEPLALRWQDVAIFDYPKWGLSSDDKFEGSTNLDQKKLHNNLMSVLSMLITSKRKTTTSTKAAMEDKTPFVLVRQRKASTAAKKKTAKPKNGSKLNCSLT
jgi:hypothetical protein